MCAVDHYFILNSYNFTLNLKDTLKQLNMDLTERELFVQQLNFDCNSYKMSPHCFQETHQVVTVRKKK
jgi:hypothetical protein